LHFARHTRAGAGYSGSMDVVREAWTDERLDDLTRRVDHGFDRVDMDLREIRSDVNSRFDTMQRTMVIGFVTVLASTVSVLASIVATQL
jgi:hypothetical protein